MRDAINSPAWGILDDWRDVDPSHRSLTLRRGGRGYILSAMDVTHEPYLFASESCDTATDLEDTALDLIVAIDTQRRDRAHREADRLRARLAEVERAELEAASSVERAAHDSERDTRASEQPEAVA